MPPPDPNRHVDLAHHHGVAVAHVARVTLDQIGALVAAGGKPRGIVEDAPVAIASSNILVSAAPASMARATKSVFSSWIDHNLSSILSASSAFIASNRALAPALECSVTRIRQAPTSCSVALRPSPCGRPAAAAPEIRMSSLESS